VELSKSLYTQDHPTSNRCENICSTQIPTSLYKANEIGGLGRFPSYKIQLLQMKGEEI